MRLYILDAWCRLTPHSLLIFLKVKKCLCVTRFASHKPVLYSGLTHINEPVTPNGNNVGRIFRTYRLELVLCYGFYPIAPVWNVLKTTQYIVAIVKYIELWQTAARELILHVHETIDTRHVITKLDIKSFLSNSILVYQDVLIKRRRDSIV